MLRMGSGYHSGSGGRISVYDDLIKESANRISWDWRLLASLVYQESRFDNQTVSWAGAKGLMQVMPETGQRFGLDSTSSSPAQNMLAGTRFLDWLDDFWKPYVPDSNERIKFVLASYNAGQGHVRDAQRLSEKYGNDPGSWQAVSYFLREKNKRKYYADPVVKHGYCRGHEPVNYVTQIISRYNQYLRLIEPDPETVYANN